MAIQVGDKAPKFSGLDQNGDIVNLANYKGKKLAIYFYPKDDTPSCTNQACNLRDNYAALQANGINIIGISTDEVKKHKKFEEKYQLPFTLIADADKKIVTDYEVWGEKQFMGKTVIGTKRTTFLINEKGIIKAIITKPITKNHSQQIIDEWAAL